MNSSDSKPSRKSRSTSDDERAYVNPAMLEWARRQAGYDNLHDEFVPKKLKDMAGQIFEWEKSEATGPTWAELKILSKEYWRPETLFFMQKEPEEDLVAEFRDTGNLRQGRHLPKVRFAVRAAYTYQKFLQEIFSEEAEQRVKMNSLRKSVRGPDGFVDSSRLRLALDIDTYKQRAIPDASKTLRFWIRALESHGVFVMQQTMDSEGDYSVSGFCLPHETFPVIVINPGPQNRKRQILTLFHELAHVLFYNKPYMFWDGLRLDTKILGHEEEECTNFAGKFLLPDAEILKFAEKFNDFNSLEDAKEACTWFSDVYKISEAATWFRMREAGQISISIHDRLADKIYKYNTPKWWGRSKKRGGDSPSSTEQKLLRHLGETYIKRLHYLHDKEVIDENEFCKKLDVCKGDGVKPEIIKKLKVALKKRDKEWKEWESNLKIRIENIKKQDSKLGKA